MDDPNDPPPPFDDPNDPTPPSPPISPRDEHRVTSSRNNGPEYSEADVAGFDFVEASTPRNPLLNLQATSRPESPRREQPPQYSPQPLPQPAHAALARQVTRQSPAGSGNYTNLGNVQNPQGYPVQASGSGNYNNLQSSQGAAGGAQPALSRQFTSQRQSYYPGQQGQPQVQQGQPQVQQGQPYPQQPPAAQYYQQSPQGQQQGFPQGVPAQTPSSARPRLLNSRDPTTSYNQGQQ